MLVEFLDIRINSAASAGPPAADQRRGATERRQRGPVAAGARPWRWRWPWQCPWHGAPGSSRVATRRTRAARGAAATRMGDAIRCLRTPVRLFQLCIVMH